MLPGRQHENELCLAAHDLPYGMNSSLSMICPAGHEGKVQIMRLAANHGEVKSFS